MPTQSSKPSQNFVQIKEIRDGVVVLKNNSMRMVLMTSSLNFALKSQEEQTAIIIGYQDFLNSLDFSLQIITHSRPININPYLELLTEAGKIQNNELIRLQIREYTEFIKTLVETTNIITKNFYVVVPYNPSFIELSGKNNIFEKIKSIFSGKTGSREEENEEMKFEEYREQLLQRVEVVIQELTRIGVRAVPLNTEEVIELFYYLYNPGEIEKGKIPTQ